MKKYLIRLCALLLVVVMIITSAGCTKTDIPMYIRLYAFNYDTFDDQKALARIVFHSFDEIYFDVLCDYAEPFLFPETKEEKESLYRLFGEAVLEFYPDYDELNIASAYCGVIWIYMLSCTMDFETFEISSYFDSEEKINEIYPKCLTLLYNISTEKKITTSNAITVLSPLIKNDNYIQSFIGTLNFFAMNHSEELADYAYTYAWGISKCAELVTETDFFFPLPDNGYRYEDVMVKNPEGKGLLKKEYSEDELINLADSFVVKENMYYEDVVDAFGALPQEYANGAFYSFHYFSGDYVVSFYGSPIYGISVSDKRTNNILYGVSKWWVDEMMWVYRKKLTSEEWNETDEYVYLTNQGFVV